MITESQAVVAHASNPGTQGADTGDLCEFEASFVYRESFRMAKDTQRNPISKDQRNK